MTLTLNRQLLTSRQILVAFSGGLDSTVLLHQLVQWRTENPGVTLRAIHVHHGLSANADAWVTHCENVCQQWQVPLVVERVQLAQEGLGIEAQARQARYQAFARTLLPGEVLVTAQHLDDQCAPISVMETAGEGGAWGIALLGAYLVNNTKEQSLADFLEEQVFAGNTGVEIQPDREDVAGFNAYIERYKAGLLIEEAAVKCKISES